MKRSKQLKGINFIVYFLLFAMMLCSTKNVANAAGASGDGSITAIFGSYGGEEYMEGAKVCVYRVADCTTIGGTFTYTLTPEFAGCGYTVDQLDGATVAIELLKYTKAYGTAGLSSFTDAQGKVFFDHLPDGIYLVVHTDKVNPFTMAEPFLVKIPYESADGLCYDINATPKVSIELLMELSVKKVWNDDGNGRPANITVALKKDNIVQDTVVLSAENGWAYTWDSLPQAPNWSVEEVNVPVGYAATYRMSGNTFIIENTPALPQTGQLWWPVPILAAIGLFLLIVGYKGFKKNED